MRANLLFALLAIGSSVYSQDVPVADVLLNKSDYLTDATFEVLLPQAEDPVIYTLTLQSNATPTDSLSPCDYVICWQTDSPQGAMSGFSAYFDGNHYRYRNNRLQEYHYDSNQAPFLPLGPGSQERGVQQTVQFADLLPQFIGRRIRQMAADSTYIYRFTPDTIVNRQPAMVLEGVKRGQGYDAMQFTYVFDHATGMPVLTDIVNSPGSISEQYVTVRYTGQSEATPIDMSEAALINRWPDVFEKYRESTFRTENLVGSKLPGFASRSYNSSERYTHNIDQPMAAPTIIVALDPAVATTGATINDVRQAIAMMPMAVDVIWAFTTNRQADIEQALGTLGPDETALISAGDLIRNCGITMYPTTLLVDRDATVLSVIPGYNSSYADKLLMIADR